MASPKESTKEDAKRWRKASGKVDWDKVPLGKEPDLHLMRILGASKAAVLYQRKARSIPACPLRNLRVDWDKVPLGDMPDTTIGALLRMSAATVSRHRRLLGIAPVQSRRRPDINWDEQPLGKMPDHQLAKKLGVRSTTVSSVRTRRGISAYRKLVCACGSPVLPPSRLFCSRTCETTAGKVRRAYAGLGLEDVFVATAAAKRVTNDRKRVEQ